MHAVEHPSDARDKTENQDECKRPPCCFFRAITEIKVKTEETEPASGRAARPATPGDLPEVKARGGAVNAVCSAEFRRVCRTENAGGRLQQINREHARKHRGKQIRQTHHLGEAFTFVVQNAFSAQPQSPQASRDSRRHQNRDVLGRLMHKGFDPPLRSSQPVTFVVILFGFGNVECMLRQKPEPDKDT